MYLMIAEMYGALFSGVLERNDVDHIPLSI